MVALILIAVTILKLFSYDLRRLGQLYRVAAFVGLDVVLIPASMLYRRLVPAESGERCSG